MTSEKKLWVALIAVAITAIFGLFFPLVQESLGAVGTRFPNGLAVGTTATVTTNKLTIGNDGTALGNVLHGTCTLVNYAGSFTATTSLNHNCSASGVNSGDKVFVSLPVNDALGIVTQAGNHIWVGGAEASTTDDNITVTLFNGTGVATTSYPQATTSVNWWAIR